ncbi:MAG: NAD-dependent deacylase [Bacteroidales bacterium]|nr:NAD-dependent deacylase [Bacteroidales bacterium]
MELINKAAQIIKNSKHTTVFTGAGISVESGIPPFRGEGGLWEKYDPKLLDLRYFYAYPQESWTVIKEVFYDFFGKAKPNPAHFAIAEMEKTGIVKAVITQNIDNLHQEAGSKNVFEYHGNSKTLVCMECDEKYSVNENLLKKLPPQCKKCGGLLKPDFIFFGEGIPEHAAKMSALEAETADVFIVIGTTGEVMPACMLPYRAKENGATIIEINPSKSSFTESITDIYLPGKAGEILPLL